MLKIPKTQKSDVDGDAIKRNYSLQSMCLGSAAKRGRFKSLEISR